MSEAIEVYTRHAPNCSKKDKRDWKTCKCPKWLYDPRTRRRWSASTKSWEKAARLARDLEQERASKHQALKASVDGFSLEEKIISYVTPMRTTLGRSEDHAEKNELWLLKRFPPWCCKNGLARLHEIESTHIEQFRSTWTVGPVTAQKATERISSFFLYCIRNKWLATNPCSGLQSISVPPPKAEYFTAEEYERIMDSISCYGLELFREDQRKIARARLSAMVELLRWTGLRISDAACVSGGAKIDQAADKKAPFGRRKREPPTVFCTRV